MVLAGDQLFVMGPPDLIDEEESFQRIMSRDPTIQAKLKEQDEALDGAQGALLLAVSRTSGEVLHQMKLESLPVWDGMASARGRLYVTTVDGKVICLGE